MKYIWVTILFFSCKKEFSDKVNINCIEIDAAKGRGKPKPIEVSTATFSILLDVDGHHVNSPSWNGGVPFYAEPSGDFDTSTAFKMAREKFQNFNISVTTDEAAWLKATYRARCVITTSDFYPNYSGVAYTGSLKSGLEFFVFSDRLYYNTQRIGNCIAHETGHSIGLSHQALWDINCNLISSYNSGDYEKAPIMGNPVGKLGLWWVGPTPYGCKDIQNDSLKLVASLK